MEPDPTPPDRTPPEPESTPDTTRPGELDEVPLRPESGPDDSGGGGFPWWIVVVVVLLLAALGAGYFLFLRGGGERAVEEPTPPVGEAPPEPPPELPPEPEEEEAIELPPLPDSDPLVRGLVGELSSHPQLASWLVGERLIRRFVAAVDNVALGESPRKHLRNLAPKEPFRAAERGESLLVDPASYGRYDLAATVFTSLDTEGTVRLYRRLEPLVDEAYRDLGYPDAEFDRTLQRAIAHLLETPIVQGEIALEEKVVSYAFADPRLEELSAAQKQLLRMGPGNVRRVQAKLRELARELGIPPEELPETPVY